MNNWEDKLQVKKGNLGEQLVDNHLRGRGFVVYKAVSEGRHPFDRICSTLDKKKMIIAEVKTKPARQYYPDTGINLKHYREYAFLRDKYNLPVVIYFVDEIKRKIYGNLLIELEKSVIILHKGKFIKYPKIEGEIIYFPLKNMVSITNLCGNEAEQIKKYTTRNQRYKYE